jgi:hypothetical protein
VLWAIIFLSFLIGLITGLYVYGFPQGIIFGIILGLFFSISITTSNRIAKYYQNKGKEGLHKKFLWLNQNSEWYSKNIQSGLSSNEEIIRYSPAKFFKRFNTMGGILILTNKQLIYKPIPTIYFQSKEFSIPLTHIINVETYNIDFIFHGGLRIFTSFSDTLNFKVRDNNVWKKLIESKIKHPEGN